MYILAFCLPLIFLAIIDARTMVLPNSITIPLIFVAIFFNQFPISYSSLTESTLGAGIGYLLIWSINKIYYLFTHKDGIGMGDAKLLAFIGALLGPTVLIPTLLIGSLLGVIGGLLWLKLKNLNNCAAFPFGPYLCSAEILIIFDSQFKIGIVKFLAL